MIALYFWCFKSWHDHQRDIEAGHNVAEMLKYIILKYSLSSIFLSRYFVFYFIHNFKKHFSNNIILFIFYFWLRRLRLQVDAYKKGLNMARQQSSDF